MKIKTEKIFSGIDRTLIENAKNEIEANWIIEKEGLSNKETGQLTEAAYEFFLKNHKPDLAVYKQDKHSGYRLIALFKGVVRVGSADFMTDRGRAMEKELKSTPDWPVYQLHELKRKVLNNLFDDPWDNRTNHEFKPSLDKIWDMFEQMYLGLI